LSKYFLSKDNFPNCKLVGLGGLARTRFFKNQSIMWLLYIMYMSWSISRCFIY